MFQTLFGAQAVSGTRCSPGEVTVQGLQSRPELNGRTAIVQSFDPAKDRCATRQGSPAAEPARPQTLHTTTLCYAS